MFNFDENIWIGICFGILLYLVYKPFKKIILKFIDSKIDEIKIRVGESENLKKEAQILLDSIEKKLNSLEKTKKQFFDEYEKETQKILDQKNKHFLEQIDDVKNASKQEIKYYQNKINNKMKDSFSDLVTSVLKEYFSKSKDKNLSAENMVDKFSKEINKD